MPQEEYQFTHFTHYLNTDRDPPRPACDIHLTPGGPGILYSLQKDRVTCPGCLGTLKTEPPPGEAPGKKES